MPNYNMSRHLRQFASICFNLLQFASLCFTLHHFVSLCVTLRHFASLCVTLVQFASHCVALRQCKIVSRSFYIQIGIHSWVRSIEHFNIQPEWEVIIGHLIYSFPPNDFHLPGRPSAEIITRGRFQTSFEPRDRVARRFTYFQTKNPSVGKF
jgi:hypothetical protein